MEVSCAECNSEKIVPAAKVIDRAEYGAEGDLAVAIDENPEAFIFKERIRSPLSARICGSCGFTEFYTENPETIYSAYLSQKANQKK